MSLFRAVCYVLAQLLGATIGAAMARHVSPEIFDRCVRWDSEMSVSSRLVDRLTNRSRKGLAQPPSTQPNPRVPPYRYNGGINYVTPDVTIGGAFLAEFMGAYMDTIAPCLFDNCVYALIRILLPFINPPQAPSCWSSPCFVQSTRSAATRCSTCPRSRPWQSGSLSRSCTSA